MEGKWNFFHLHLETDVVFFFHSIQEFMNFSATTIAERTPAGQRQSVESESNYQKIQVFFFLHAYSL